ncbi:AraC family transcriptional regulator [Nonomuraea sp. LP-02]|uniref:AraC family transcriptional regulator n=1 Tax=Nonomuraea sp. LP-02 TaxID=3097960 RepID=UPI002E337980|nr:AraC family transcriptional regulator [Nonomuraea sp. LP-02]MED7930504.1 AraC family transcriptional regulator [Nonomuraea sp. LP-02]
MLDELGRAEHDLWPVPPLSVDLLCRVLTSPAGGAGWLTAAWREALCAAAVIDLIRGSSGPEAGVTVEHPGLRRALRWLDDHLEEPVTVNRLVEVSGMSAFRFYETFTETLGTSPKDYVLRAKIARAERMLTEGDDSVTEVAHRLGFSSSQYFASTFRRYQGLSPTQYRRGQ